MLVTVCVSDNFEIWVTDNDDLFIEKSHDETDMTKKSPT